MFRNLLTYITSKMCFKEDGAEYMYNYYSLFFCRVLLKYYMSFMSFIKELQSMKTIFALLTPKRFDRFWNTRFDAEDQYLRDNTCVYLSNTTYFPKSVTMLTIHLSISREKSLTFTYRISWKYTCTNFRLLDLGKMEETSVLHRVSELSNFILQTV